MEKRKLQTDLIGFFRYFRMLMRGGDRLLNTTRTNRIRAPAFQTKESRFTLDTRNTFNYQGASETLTEAAQRGYRFLIPGNFQDHVGPDSEQPALIQDVLAHCQGLLDQMTFKVSPNPNYSDSVHVVNTLSAISTSFSAKDESGGWARKISSASCILSGKCAT